MSSLSDLVNTALNSKPPVPNNQHSSSSSQRRKGRTNTKGATSRAALTSPYPPRVPRESQRGGSPENTDAGNVQIPPQSGQNGRVTTSSSSSSFSSSSPLHISTNLTLGESPPPAISPAPDATIAAARTAGERESVQRAMEELRSIEAEAKGGTLTPELRNKRRLIQNRLAAQRSRIRKKEYIAELEVGNANHKIVIAKLRAKIDDLQNSLLHLSTSVQSSSSSSSSSSSHSDHLEPNEPTYDQLKTLVARQAIRISNLEQQLTRNEQPSPKN